MSDSVNAAGREQEARALTWRERWQRVRCAALVAVAALVVIWMLLPWLPAAWGVSFGTPYLTFFSLAVVGAAGFFMLLDWGPIREPRSAFTTFASILFVYVATVGGMVAFGTWYYPQFETPRTAAPSSGGESAVEKRGKEVFLRPQFGCFACHTIEALGIRGGQRGPDLSDAGKQAEIRKPGMSAGVICARLSSIRGALTLPAAGSSSAGSGGCGEGTSNDAGAKERMTAQE